MKKNFDTKLQRLEEIVDAIQDKSVGLEDSMKLFEEGVALTSECLTFLKESKGHIEDMSQRLKSLNIDEDSDNE